MNRERERLKNVNVNKKHKTGMKYTRYMCRNGRIMDCLKKKEKNMMMLLE